MKISNFTFLSLILCLLFSSTVLAKGGNDHRYDMLAVLGITPQLDKKLAKRLQPTIEVFRKHIDCDYRDFYRGLRLIMLPHKFSWGNYKHRIFFHWGFNTDPRHSQSLTNQFNQATSDPEVKERGFDYIINVGNRTNSRWNSHLKKINDSAPENLKLKIPTSVKGQAARNREMLLAVGWLSPASRDHHRAVATILYNTHILGDYEEGVENTQSALQPFKDVVKDTIKYGVMNFDCSYSLKKQFEKEMWKASKSTGTVKDQAIAILNVMKTYIPQCIDNSKIIKRIVWGQERPSLIIQPPQKKNVLEQLFSKFTK